MSNPSNEISGAQWLSAASRNLGEDPVVNSACPALTERICILSITSEASAPFSHSSSLLTLSFPDIFLRVRDNETLTVWWLPILFCQVNPVYKWSVTISFTKKYCFQRKLLAHTLCPLPVLSATISTSRPLPPLSHLFFCWSQSLTRFSQIYSI